MIERVADQTLEPKFKALVVRDSLECLVQLLFAWIRKGQEQQLRLVRTRNQLDREYFGRIASWSDNILTQDEFRRVLVPAYAPLFFFAILDAYGFRQDRSAGNAGARRCLRILQRNFDKYHKWAGELAVYSSTEYPGKLGLYNLDIITETTPQYVAALQHNDIAESDHAAKRNLDASPRLSTTAGGYIEADLDQCAMIVDELLNS